MITAVFFIGAISITFFIPKKYRAYGVVYPTNSNSIKETAVNPDFGFEIQADRLIQLFESKQMKDKIVEDFDLISYYELDTNSDGWRYKLAKNYSGDITFSRTRYLSVVIQANMKDPDLASDIVNTAMEYIDTIRKEMYLSNIRLLMSDYKEKIEIQQKKVNELFDSISTISESGSPSLLTDVRASQIEERQRSGKRMDGDAVILEKIKKNPSLSLERVVDIYYRELEILNMLLADANATEQLIELPFPKVYPVVTAVSDRKKVSPSFTTHGIIGLLIGFFLSLTWIVLRARLRDVLKEVR